MSHTVTPIITQRKKNSIARNPELGRTPQARSTAPHIAATKHRMASVFEWMTPTAHSNPHTPT